MPKKQKSNSLGAAVFWFVAILIWLVVTYPWLLLLAIGLWFCIVVTSQPKQVRRRPRARTITPAPAPRTMIARPPLRKATPAPAPKVIAPPAKVAPPDFIPKDREYNRSLARTWDEEFEALEKKRDQYPQP